MKKLILAAVLLAALSSCSRKENYTVIVSLDAFRWDYLSLYDTPNLDSIAAVGVNAVMKPSYPASTFPNHYTLATGLYPDHHGIVNSQFWDPEAGVRYSMGDTLTRNNPAYYGGEPVWVTARKQGVKTGNIYWVGSDIPIQGLLPDYYRYWYDLPRLDYAQRMDDALRLLRLPEKERPRLVMVYFDEPDMTGHEFGPESIETGIMVHYLDSLVGNLCKGIRALPYADRVNVIVTSDHGMTSISDERFINLPALLKNEWVVRSVSSNPVSLYTAPGCRDSVLQALSGVEHLNAWKSEEVPEELHYGTSPHLGDVIVAPELGWQVAGRPRGLGGAHGYSPEEKDMQVLFRAFGPDFKEGFSFGTVFPNVDVYPLLCRLIGVKPAPCDGSLEDVEEMLK